MRTEVYFIFLIVFLQIVFSNVQRRSEDANLQLSDHKPVFSQGEHTGQTDY